MEVLLNDIVVLIFDYQLCHRIGNLSIALKDELSGDFFIFFLIEKGYTCG